MKAACPSGRFFATFVFSDVPCIENRCTRYWQAIELRWHVRLSTDPISYEYADGVLNDRIILVTGASDGIGKALAVHIAGLGAQVVLHGRNTKNLKASTIRLPI